MAGHSAAELKQGLNAYNVLVLVVLGIGSLTYGYTASIIGTTLGEQYQLPLINAYTIRTTIIHQIHGT